MRMLTNCFDWRLEPSDLNVGTLVDCLRAHRRSQICESGRSREPLEFPALLVSDGGGKERVRGTRPFFAGMMRFLLAHVVPRLCELPAVDREAGGASRIECQRCSSSTTRSRYETTFGSSKTRAAVSNETPCFRRLVRFYSHPTRKPSVSTKV